MLETVRGLHLSAPGYAELMALCLCVSPSEAAWMGVSADQLMSLSSDVAAVYQLIVCTCGVHGSLVLASN